MATNFIFKMAHSHPLLRNKLILYQSGQEFFYFEQDKVFLIDDHAAARIALSDKTFYILDGFNTEPVHSKCLTLFMGSSRSDYFTDWHYKAQITPSYFPAWSLKELRDCRTLCYPTIDVATVDRRYKQYGGDATYVFWSHGEPPSFEGVITDSDARKSI